MRLPPVAIPRDYYTILERGMAVSKLFNLTQKRSLSSADELQFSMWINTIFPKAVWPVYSGLVRNTNTYFLRLRDSKGTIILFPAKKMPKFVLKQRSFLEIYNTDKVFKKLIDEKGD